MNWIKIDDLKSLVDQIPEEIERLIVYGKTTCGECYPENAVFEVYYWRGELFHGEYDCGVEAKYWRRLPKPPK